MNGREVATLGERAGLFCDSQRAPLTGAARQRLGALLAVAAAVVAVVLAVAPLALAGTGGAGYLFNSGTGLVWIHVKNTSASVPLNSIDFTLGSGAISGTPTADSAGTYGGGSCTMSTAQSASCTFNPPLAPTSQGDADNEIGGINAHTSPPTNPGSVSYTAHFGDGSTASGIANQCPSSITLTPPPGSLPDGTVNSAYNAQMSGPSGTTYKQASGAVVPGVTLSQYGLWSGTPTQGGTYGFQLNVYDANGCPFFPSYMLKVNDAPPPTPVKHYDLIVTIDPMPGQVVLDAAYRHHEGPPYSLEFHWLVTVSNSPTADMPSPATTLTITRSSSNVGPVTDRPGTLHCNFSSGFQQIPCSVPLLNPGESRTYNLRDAFYYDGRSFNTLGSAVGSGPGPSVSVPCGSPDESEPANCPNNSATGFIPHGFGAPLGAEFSGPKSALEAFAELIAFKGAASPATERPAKLRTAAMADAPTDPVAKVEVAVLRTRPGVRSARVRSCEWLNSHGKLTRTKPGKNGCDSPLWLLARGTTHWRYVIRHGLPRGRYFAYARATSKSGASDATFTAKRRNKIKINVR